MPLKFDDAAQHAANLPNLGDRVAAFFQSIRSRLQQVDGRDSLNELIADLDTHHDLMVRTTVGDANTATGAYRGRLGPGETPVMPGDRIMSNEESERHGNPTAPYDASGHKVHPADAASIAGRTDPKQGQGFGGNGIGAGADIRSQILTDERQPDSSLQETLARQRAGGLESAGTKIPVVQNEIVVGSERTDSAGVRYVTKRWADGSTLEVVDKRPANEPV